MNVHHPSYKRKIYKQYYEELIELKRNLEYTEQLNQWELNYKITRRENSKRKFGTPILLKLWKTKNILKSLEKQKMEIKKNDLKTI